MHIKGVLNEYAYHLWNGLIADFYYPRWAQWVSGVAAALEAGQAFDETAYITAIEAFEEAWTHEQGNPYALAPSGDVYELAAAIWAKYFTA